MSCGLCLTNLQETDAFIEVNTVTSLRFHSLTQCLGVMLLLSLSGCKATQAPASRAPSATSLAAAPESRSVQVVAQPHISVPTTVLTGLDVLEANHFLVLQGKRIGLLTHPAGANRKGVSAVEVLRHAPGVNLVALFGTEHGVYDELPASSIYPDHKDAITGLPIFSLYNGKTHRPTKAQLKGVDALVVDLQDIGVRSYTFTGAMKQVMEGCFENNVEVIVLDRPNPLGGLKVDGPLLDAPWLGSALVNEFPVPYVHGLTIGELARYAKETPGILRIPEVARVKGRLTVVPMVGWQRKMRWPDTGLTWLKTSTNIPTYAAVMGYPMTGLGTIMGHFSSGVGTQYPFRGIYNQNIRTDVLKKELENFNIPGLQYRVVSVPTTKASKSGQGLFVEVADWDLWRPTELNFYMMKLTCKYDGKNPYALAGKTATDGFIKHVGSSAFFHELAQKGARIDVEAYMKRWQAEDAQFQQKTRVFWLYH